MNQHQCRRICLVINATTATVYRPRGPTETGSWVMRIASAVANTRARRKRSVVISALAGTSLRVLCDSAFVMVAMMLWE
jgi:hypothetical protein